MTNVFSNMLRKINSIQPVPGPDDDIEKIEFWLIEIKLKKLVKSGQVVAGPRNKNPHHEQDVACSQHNNTRGKTLLIRF